MATVIKMQHPTRQVGAVANLPDGSQVVTDAYGQAAITISSALSRAISGLVDAGWSEVESSAVLGRLPWVASRFYGPNGIVMAGVLTVASRLYAVPILVPNAITVNTMCYGVGTGQTGGAGTCGIYADNGGAPGALLGVTPEGIATSGAGAVTVTFATPLALPAGWYWLASQFKASSTMPTIIGMTVGDPGVSMSLGQDTAAHALAAALTDYSTGVIATVTYASASMPNPAPTMTLISSATCPAPYLGT